MQQVRGWACAVVVTQALWLAACGEDAASDGRDAGASGSSEVDAGGGGGTQTDRCKEDSDCSDGVYCNGREVCAPNRAGADAAGCLPGDPPCAAEDCDEDARRCSCENPDRDGDGRDAVACGGEDCDDDDPRRFGGNIEVCDPDGHDEDCDLTTLGGPQDADVDNDGFVSTQCCNFDLDGALQCGNDCDDSREGVHPEVTEACNGIDDNCDEVLDGVDEAGDLRLRWYRDADGDGHGRADDFVEACGDPSSFGARYANAAGDCNDAPENDTDDIQAGAMNPGVPELCDVAGNDDDCDGEVDEGCDCFAGDTLPCGPFDENGGLLTDDGGEPLTTGACARGFIACVEGAWAGDNCLGAVGPVPEVCDNRDNDCDGDTDEPDSVGAPLWYPDLDGDGFGSDSGAVRSCTTPGAGYLLAGGDCLDDPNDPDNGHLAQAVHVGATEECDGAIDHNCNGLVDESCPCSDGDDRPCGPYYPGTDIPIVIDGQPETRGQCQQGTQSCIAGRWAPSCEGVVNPAANEICDDENDDIYVDNDCDGVADESDALFTKDWYLDRDGDGFGDPNTETTACHQPPDEGGEAYVTAAGNDCDDSADNRYPGAFESCDGAVDHNCNGLDDAADGCVCTNGDSEACGPFDANGNDLDGLGTGDCTAGTRSCIAGQWSSCGGFVGPTPETCDYRDNDCDGEADEPGATGERTWYLDADGDRYGDPGAQRQACGQPDGYVADATDCDDGAGNVYPGAREICDGVINHDCDGAALDANDDDCECINGASEACGPFAEDGTDLNGLSTGVCNPGTRTCRVGAWGDCNGFVAPSTERCDGFDNDCNGATDEAGSVGETTFYRDVDGDGFGDANASQRACTKPDGYVLSNTDCDVNADNVYPGATEVCDGVINHNCNGVSADIDEPGCDCVNGGQRACGPLDSAGDLIVDGGGNPLTTGACHRGIQNCVGGYWDTCAQYRGPTATEICNNGIADDNCDGLVDADDPSATGLSNWYLDADGDQLGDPDTQVPACTQPPDNGGTYVASGSDCYDGDASVLAQNSCALVYSAGTQYSCQYSAYSGHDDCVVTGCPAGTGDCNADHLDHCEADLSLASSCGSCGTTCQLLCDDYAGPLACDELVDLAAGTSHTCGIRASGLGACWGANSYGQLATGTYLPYRVPVELAALTGITAIDSGSDHTCATAESGVGSETVYCWGSNAYGQAGVDPGVSTSVLLPARSQASPLFEVDGLAVGNQFACAIVGSGADTGEVHCWGRNNYEQLGLGNGNTADEWTSPLTVRGVGGSGVLEDAAVVAAGGTHACAVHSGGDVACWGLAGGGRLGVASTPAHCSDGLAYACEEAVDTGVTGAIALSAGLGHACAIVGGSPNTVRCWGDIDGSGEPAFPQYSTPTTVATLQGSTQIASGDYHVCGLLGSGAIRCIGRNGSYQLGSASTAATSATTADSGYVRLTAGGNHTCAIAGDDTTQCWGDNGSGQLGVGDVASRPAPTAVEAMQQ